MNPLWLILIIPVGVLWFTGAVLILTGKLFKKEKQDDIQNSSKDW